MNNIPRIKDKLKSSISKEHIHVIADDPAENPHCAAHGPALKLCKTFDDGSPAETFFACSAHRDRAVCPIRNIYTKSINAAHQMEEFEHRYADQTQALEAIKSRPRYERGYCGRCARFVPLPEFKTHSDHRLFVRNLSDDMIKYPTKFLSPLDNDQTEAQYFFADRTLAWLGETFKALDFRKVICIGAPRLHEYLREHKDELGISSVLLDLDYRLEKFYDRTEFFLYNMFNNYFMDGLRRKDEFEKTLHDSEGGKILLFTDPPFGCRTEPLAATIKTIARRYQRRNGSPYLLPVMWVFPYFMQTYVQQVMPEMEMIAYRVNYTNHRSYRLDGSPIRVFTNIPLSLIPLPSVEYYKWCKRCERGCTREETHCDECRVCPSKNGYAYAHCAKCAVCVKSSYKHCARCGRCTQVQGHQCAEYAAHQTCWICGRKGHVEVECERWLSTAKGMKMLRKYRKSMGKGSTSGGGRMCLLCGQCGHNERTCAQRAALLDERRFMQEVYNVFSQEKDVGE